MRTAEYQHLLENYCKAAQESRPRFNERIEKYRKGHGKIILVDEKDAPLRRALVEILQKNHAFKFGCNCLMLDQMGSPEKNEEYERRFADLFNLATTTFCLCAIQPRPGEYRFVEDSEFIYRRPPADRPVRISKKYGLALKGQPLLCDSWHPVWAPQEADAVRQMYREFFEKVAQRYGDSPYYLWDVVNEAFSCPRRTPDFPLLDEEFHYVDWAFREARKIFPRHHVMELNEGTRQNCGEAAQRYLKLVKRLMLENVPVESVGLQMHIFSADKHMQRQELDFFDMENTYLAYADLGMPIAITEVTVQSALPDCPRELGEEIQSAILENLYRLWFSAPTMHSITFWNFADGLAWGKEGNVLGCLLDSELKPKPAYQKLYQMIHREWNTKCIVTTDDDGIAEFDGFYGDYEVHLLQEQNMEQVGYTKTPGAWNVDPNRHIPRGKFSLSNRNSLEKIEIK